MKTPLAAIAAATALFPLTATAWPGGGGPVTLPVDQPTRVAGYEVACTGVGQTKADPQWKAYSTRIEFSDHENAYLGTGQVEIADQTGVILALRCDAPWILVKLPAGAYTVTGRVPGSTVPAKTARFTAPAHGQMRLVLKFPEI